MISLKKRRTQQPAQVVKPDYSNPLNKGLKGLFYPVNGSLVDVMHSALPSFDDSTSRIGRKGRYRAYSNQQTRFASNSDYGLASAMTIIFIVDVDSLANFNGVIYNQEGNNDTGYGVRLGLAGDASDIFITRAASFSNRFHTISAGDQISAGSKDNFVAITFAGNLIETPPVFMNVNGTKHTAFDVGGSGTGAQLVSTEELRIGKREDGSTYLNGAVNFIALFDRELSFFETEQIRKNPYQLLQPITQYIPAFIPAVGGASIMNQLQGSNMGADLYNGTIL